MPPSRPTAGVFAALLALPLGACVIDGGSYAGRRCDTATDCPSPYVCLIAKGRERTCELLLPPGIQDGGNEVPTVFYCGQVAPLMKKYCVSNCHGQDTAGSGRSDFRLDAYGTVAGKSGCLAKAVNIKNRTADDYFKGGAPMPPDFPAGLPKPTDDERRLVSAWYLSGALYSPDGGGPCDGGP